MLIWELAGAVVGAGMASGREIASFFAEYGTWGYVGVVLASGVLVFLGDTRLPSCWHDRWQALLWNGLLSLLLIATGGAMLSGAGEVAELMFPIRYAYWLGIGGTLAAAWLLARRTATGLACVSRVLLLVLTVMIGLGMFLPEERAAVLLSEDAWKAAARGLTYGGFNAALLVPVLTNSAEHNMRKRKAALRWAGGIICCLLILGNAVLQRHSALLGEAMPFLKMISKYGVIGYYLGSFSLYLAVLSTLTACMRGLSNGRFPIIGIVLSSLLGFNGVVNGVYPILGGCCILLLVAAKIMNCSSRSFLSIRDMI